MTQTADALARAVFIIVAFVLAGLAHSAWLGSRWSRRLLIPLDGGLRVRGRRVFGENKTVRGFVVMIPAAALSFWGLSVVLFAATPTLANGLWPISAREYGALGAWAGLGFMLGELPNSFIKRQLDVAPGRAPRGARRGVGVVRCRPFGLDCRIADRHRARRSDTVDDVGVRRPHRAGDSFRVQRVVVQAGREGARGMTAASRVIMSSPTRAERYVLSLELVNDVTLVGGKAHALGRAMRAGIRVPAGIRAHDPGARRPSRRARAARANRGVLRDDRCSRSGIGASVLASNS
jgi:hypothetical protein